MAAGRSRSPSETRVPSPAVSGPLGSGGAAVPVAPLAPARPWAPPGRLRARPRCSAHRERDRVAARPVGCRVRVRLRAILRRACASAPGGGLRRAGCRCGRTDGHGDGPGRALRRGRDRGTGRCGPFDGGGRQPASGEELEDLKRLLRRLRVERGFSVGGLARRARLGRTTTSQALNGATVPSEATLVSLAHALRAPADPLLRLRALARPGGNAPAVLDATRPGVREPAVRPLPAVPLTPAAPWAPSVLAPVRRCSSSTARTPLNTASGIFDASA